MEKRSSPPLVLVILIVLCLIALFVFLPATSPLNTIRDTDGDSHADAVDTFPNDNTEWRDTDKDGHGDHIDRYPTDAQEWSDSDNDSWPDNKDAFPHDPFEHADLDRDGVGDGADAFPRAASQWIDSDGDGFGDNLTGWQGDAFPNDRYEWNDSDHDGHGDNHDADSNDPNVWANATASMIITLSGLANEGYVLLTNGDSFASVYDNISQYIIIEIEVAWQYGPISSSQVQLTAISYIWSYEHWEVSAQAQSIVEINDGGQYFLTLEI